MAMSERDRKALLLGGAAVALLAVYLLAIEPLLAGYANLVDEHERLAGRVAKLRYERDRDAWYANRVKEFEENVHSLDPLKPYDEQITAVSTAVVAAAMGNGVQLKGATLPTTPSTWQNEPGLAMALIHLDAEAEWEKVFAFINALYRIPGLLSVERMEMTSDPKKGGRIGLRLAVSVLAARPSPTKGATPR